MKKFIALASAVIVPTVALVIPQAVNAAPPANSNNVTICHRTHSVTNPYVRITVDQRSVGNANSKHGGGAHDYWASSVYASKPNPNVYDPSKTYPANDKKDSSEKVLSTYTVTVKAGTGNSSTQTYTITTDSAGNYEVANIPAGNWIVTPAALPSANYEKVYDSDSSTVSADWVVTASVPATGTATADFATALTAAAVAAGATDTLGAVAVTTTTVAAAESSTTGTASASIPETGMGSTGLLVSLATLSGIIGAALLQIRRRRLEA